MVLPVCPTLFGLLLKRLYKPATGLPCMYIQLKCKGSIFQTWQTKNENLRNEVATYRYTWSIAEKLCIIRLQSKPNDYYKLFNSCSMKKQSQEKSRKRSSAATVHASDKRARGAERKEKKNISGARETVVAIATEIGGKSTFRIKTPRYIHGERYWCGVTLMHFNTTRRLGWLQAEAPTW